MIRVKASGGTKLMPHRHPEDRIYTVMSGVFYVGLGDRFDGDKVQAFPPGSVIVLPGNTPHFHWAKSGEYHASYCDRPARPRISRSRRRSARAGAPIDPIRNAARPGQPSHDSSHRRRDGTMTMRTRSIAWMVLAVVVLLAAVQFGAAVLSGLSQN